MSDSVQVYRRLLGYTRPYWRTAAVALLAMAAAAALEPLVPTLLVNELVYLEAPGATPLYAKVTEITGKTAVLKTLKDAVLAGELDSQIEAASGALKAGFVK